MSYKLKPCPFCGGHAELDSNASFREFVSGKISRSVTVYCESCTAEITVCVPDVPDIQPEQLADMWNQRADGRIELVNALYSLASDFENSMYAFGGDSEARNKAEGDIAHAKKVASRYNCNGCAAI